MLKIGPEIEQEVVGNLAALRARRNQAEVQKALARITADAKASRNVMESLIAGAKAYATVGEMMKALEEALGRFDSGQIW